jgi:hypothetical protein
MHSNSADGSVGLAWCRDRLAPLFNRWGSTAVASLAAATGLALALSSGPARAADNPLQWSTDDGEHTLSLSLVSRWRIEAWDAHATDTDWFNAFRSRAGLKYVWKDRLTAFAEFQDVRIHGLSGSKTSGAGRLYYTHSGMDSNESSQRIRQLWLEVQPVENLRLKLGRQDIKLGTEVMYPEPNWKYLKIARGSQRLVGTVGWTNVERSNDGGVISYDFGDYLLYGFAAKPTTGVFDINGAYSSQNDILYGGGTFTAKRDVWIPNTEVRLFGIAYKDDREVTDGFVPPGFTPVTAANEDVDVFTVGFSAIGIHPMGPGNLDLMLWGAYQWGDWVDLDHQAFAGIFEAGYQFTEVAWKPWFRGGVNFASGDGSSTDGDHEAFFNMLPTNHLYYGFSDQLAFSNLIDIFAQLKFSPLPKTDVNLFLHRFQLYTSDDFQYFGTGAFNRNNFGYGANPSANSRSVGTGLDAVVTYKFNPNLDFQGGYSYIWGNAVWNRAFSDDDVRFAYFQVTVRYP